MVVFIIPLILFPLPIAVNQSTFVHFLKCLNRNGHHWGVSQKVDAQLGHACVRPADDNDSGEGGGGSVRSLQTEQSRQSKQSRRSSISRRQSTGHCSNGGQESRSGGR